MKLDAGMLRVVCLVASAVSAGYLWRAALEGDNELTRLLDTSTPPASVSTTTFIPPTRAPALGGLSPDRLLAEPERTAPKASGPTRRKPRPRARPAAAAKPTARTPRVAPEPTAAGDEVPGPAGGTAKPPKSPSKPPAPPAGTPGPKPGPTGGPSAPPPAPAPSPAPAPEPAPPAVPEPPVTDVGVPPHWPTSPPDPKPGWGTGDKNHEHSGPPGQSGK